MKVLTFNNDDNNNEKHNYERQKKESILSEKINEKILPAYSPDDINSFIKCNGKTFFTQIYLVLLN